MTVRYNEEIYSDITVFHTDEHQAWLMRFIAAIIYAANEKDPITTVNLISSTSLTFECTKRNKHEEWYYAVDLVGPAFEASATLKFTPKFRDALFERPSDA